MRCYICDKILEEDQVQFNQDHEDYDPCPSCLYAIEDLVAGYRGQPDPEDDLDLSLILEGLFPTVHDPLEGDEL